MNDVIGKVNTDVHKIRQMCVVDEKANYVKHGRDALIFKSTSSIFVVNLEADILCFREK